MSNIRVGKLTPKQMKELHKSLAFKVDFSKRHKENCECDNCEMWRKYWDNVWNITHKKGGH